MIKKCEICGREMDKKDYPNYSYVQFEGRRFCSKSCKWKDGDYREIMDSVLRNQVKTDKQISQCKEMGEKNKGKHRSKDTEFKPGEDHLNWKGGTSKYRGADWRDQRKKIIERDGYTCRRCGAEDGLCVHHVTKYSQSKDNSPDNLITLCRRCHIIHERGYSTLIIDGEDIVIRHVPKKERDIFIDFSETDFEGNTGMALKWLIDFYVGAIGAGHERAESKADEALNAVSEMKQQPEQKYRTIEICDGTKRKVKL